MNVLRYFLLLLLLSVASMRLAAQQAVSLSPLDARLSVRQDTIDLGTVLLGSCAVDSFAIENLGVDPLRILRPVTLDDPHGEISLSATFDSLTLGPRRFIRIAVTYCPNDSGCVAARVVCASVDGGTDTLTVIGCAATKDPLTERDTIDFGLVRIGTTADSIYNVVNETGDPDVITDIIPDDDSPFSLVTEIPAGGLSVPPHGSTPVAFRFAPTERGPAQMKFRMIVGGNKREIVTMGIGGTPVIQIIPPEMDFGDVPFGRFSDSQFAVRNTGDLPLELRGVTFSTSEFTPTPGQSFPMTIPPDGMANLSVRFTPSSDDRTFADVGLVASDADPNVVLARVRGRGVSGGDIESGRIVWLDTVDAHVGEPTHLRLLVDPGLKAEEQTPLMRIRIRFDPHAVDPTALLPGPDLALSVDCSLVRLDDSTADLTIQSPTTPIEGADLARLELLGLSTGKDLNTISIIETELSPGPTPRTGNGLVGLEGCVVGRAPDIFSRVRIRSIATDGVNGEAVVRYDAPPGASGTVRIVDLSGRMSARTDIPETTGETEELRFPLNGLPPGVYILMLRVGEDWSSMPIFYSRNQ